MTTRRRRPGLVKFPASTGARRRPATHDNLRAKLAPLFDGQPCPRCGRQMLDELPVGHPQKLTMEHLIAYADGGPTDESNVTFICSLCNSKRGRREVPAPSYMCRSGDGSIIEDW